MDLNQKKGFARFVTVVKLTFEDEKHFILTCDRYINQRQILFRHLSDAFNLLDSNEKFKYLITQEYRHDAKYITQSFLY